MPHLRQGFPRTLKAEGDQPDTGKQDTHQYDECQVDFESEDFHIQLIV
jgi:hypothetical protein